MTETVANPPPAEPRGRAWRVFARVWIITGTYAYAAAVLAALALIRWVGDRWWGVTALLFAPRWLFLAPAVPLTLLAVSVRRPEPRRR